MSKWVSFYVLDGSWFKGWQLPSGLGGSGGVGWYACCEPGSPKDQSTFGFELPCLCLCLLDHRGSGTQWVPSMAVHVAPAAFPETGAK